jgi:hypothetical protein
MIELACPERCQYLQDARHSTIERRVERLVQHLADQGKGEMLEVIEQYEPLIYLIERAIVEVQRYTFRDLTDREILAGVHNALKTYETLDHGVIYEYKAESPRIQSVSEAVLRALNEVKTSLQKAGRSSVVTTRGYLAVLRLVAEEIQAELKSATRDQAFLRQTSLFYPYPQQETHQVIITG